MFFKKGKKGTRIFLNGTFSTMVRRDGGEGSSQNKGHQSRWGKDRGERPGAEGLRRRTGEGGEGEEPDTQRGGKVLGASTWLYMPGVEVKGLLGKHDGRWGSLPHSVVNVVGENSERRHRDISTRQRRTTG